jgi:hypothetical protein
MGRVEVIACSRRQATTAAAILAFVHGGVEYLLAPPFAALEPERKRVQVATARTRGPCQVRWRQALAAAAEARPSPKGVVCYYDQRMLSIQLV